MKADDERRCDCELDNEPRSAFGFACYAGSRRRSAHSQSAHTPLLLAGRPSNMLFRGMLPNVLPLLVAEPNHLIFIANRSSLNNSENGMDRPCSRPIREGLDRKKGADNEDQYSSWKAPLCALVLTPKRGGGKRPPRESDSHRYR